MQATTGKGESRRSGSYRVPIRVDWAPQSEWASESPSCFDALELAEECVKSWRKFFAEFPEPDNGRAAGGLLQKGRWRVRRQS
jgi:hypothetical protein